MYDFIDADSPEEAKRIYTDKVNKGEIEISNPQWWTFSEGDCSEPMECEDILEATLEV